MLLLVLSVSLITSCTKYENVFFDNVEFFRVEGTEKWSVRTIGSKQAYFEEEIDRFELINLSGFPSGCFTIYIGNEKRVISSYNTEIQTLLNGNSYTSIERIGDKNYAFITAEGKHILPVLRDVPYVVQDIIHGNNTYLYTTDGETWGATGNLYSKDAFKSGKIYDRVFSPIYDRVIAIQAQRNNVISPLAYYAEREGETILFDCFGDPAEVYQIIDFFSKKATRFEITKPLEYPNNLWRSATKSYINTFKSIPLTEEPKKSSTLMTNYTKIGCDNAAIITIIK